MANKLKVESLNYIIIVVHLIEVIELKPEMRLEIFTFFLCCGNI